MKRLSLLLLLFVMMAFPAMAADDAVSVNSSSVTKNVTCQIDDSGVIWEWMPDYLSNDKKAKKTATVETKSVDDEYTKSLLHLNGTDGSTVFTDEAGKTWSAAGNAQIDTAESVFGGASLVHDGSGDYISTSDSPDWDLRQAFTVDFWVRFDELPPSVTLVGTNAIDSRYYKPGWLIAYQRELEVLRMSYHDGSSWKYHMYSPWDASTDTWYHVAVSRDENGVLRHFINGQMTGSMVNTNSITSGPQNLFIGGINGLSANSFSGNIDEVRISKGIARWTENFTPPMHEYGMEVAPIADFTGSPVSGYAPLTVQFTDASENDPTSWSWNFGDGGTSILQNPPHQYDSAGTYTVSLTAANGAGNDTETKSGYVVVGNSTYSMTSITLYTNASVYPSLPYREEMHSIIQNWLTETAGWDEEFYESNQYVEDTDFGTENSGYQGLDEAVLHYHYGHGGDNNGETYVPYTYWPNGYLSHNEVYKKWDKNNKWIIFDACNILSDSDNWSSTLKYSHGLLGFVSEKTPNIDLPDKFLDNCINYDYTIAYSWELATKEVYLYSNYVAGVIFDNQNQYENDHLPGEGEVASDEYPDDEDYFFITWTC